MRDIHMFKNIGPRMEAARMSCGMTQRDAAIVLGVSRSVVSRVERAEVDAQVAVLVNMATLYGVSTDYLLFGVERYARCPEHGRPECRILFTPRDAGQRPDKAKQSL